MGALSNLYFNNIGYNGTGYVGDNFASTMNMMFNGVNGVSIFGCGYPGFGDLGGGFCPNNNAYWGMQAGFAGFNILTGIITARISNNRAAKAEAKAQDAKDNQSYEDALKTLGLNDKAAEELTVEDINDAKLDEKYQNAVDELNRKIGDDSTGLTKEYNDAKTNLTTAENNLKVTVAKLDELRGKLKTDDADSDEQKKLRSDIEALEKTKEQQKKAVETAQTKLNEKDTALNKAKDELKKAEQERDTALKNLREAQRIAKEYLPKAQAKAKEAREVREKQEAKEAKKAERAQRREDRRAERKEKRNNFLLDIADGNDKKIADKAVSDNKVDNLQSAIYSFKTAKTDADKNIAASICKEYIDTINTKDLKANERIQYNITKRAYDAIIKPWLEDYEKNNPDK